MCTQQTAPTQLLQFVESLYVVIQNVRTYHVNSTMGAQCLGRHAHHSRKLGGSMHTPRSAQKQLWAQKLC